MQKRWRLPEIDETLFRRLAEDTQCSAVLAKLLVRRGVKTSGDAAAFLDPKLLDLAEPDALPNVDLAVDRIERSLRDDESVAIFGDYDVDGVSSTCLLVDFFRLIGKEVRFRLPHRLSEGYGLREEAVRELVSDGVQLIITVDNGSSAKGPIEVAKELGADVVVIDHHQPAEDLPEPYAHVNPLLDTSGRCFRSYAGVGVAFQVVWALCQRLSKAKKISDEFRRFLVDSLGLVALGTIADVVPLVGENRILAKYGLIALQNSTRPGIRKLVDACLQSGRPTAVRRMEASHVGFRAGPRINAAGRLGSAGQAIELLSAESEERAAELLEQLESENERRRDLDARILATARERVLNELDLSKDRAIVLGDADWHPGVVGIVASRLVEEFYRPTLLFALEGDRSRGSARSIPGVNIFEAMSRCSHLFRKYGGHSQAAGAEIDSSRLPDLQRALSDAVELPIEEMVPEVEADCSISLREVDASFLDDVKKLAPYGEGNPEPSFVARDVEVVGQPRRMGKTGQHLSFFVREQGRAFRAVAFGKGDFVEQLEPRKAVSLLF
ncbi:MAG: single-stranded-DNA-specific exonuclease RecJ, partial [Planctomycetota bacterium]